MALDIPHAFSRSAPQRKLHASIHLKIATLHAQGALAAYNPSGAPYAGAFYMGR